MNELLDEPRPKRFRSLKGFFLFIASAILVILIGIYVGNVIFGERSYIVLKSLQKQKVFLYKDVARLKEENAKLQKLYLERVALDPDIKK